MDIDSRLREAGQRWRASQGPALEHPSPASLEDDAPTRKWRKGLVPLAAAAAAAGIIFGIVSLQGASTNGQQVPAGTATTHPSSVTSPVPKPSTSTSPHPSSTAAAPPAAACVGSQLRPSLGTSGAAAGTGIVQVLLRNVSGERCYLGGVFPLQGVKAAGATARLVFPGDSATAYPNPVVPGNVEPGDSGAFWLTTELNGCQRGTRFAQLVIELSPTQHVQMPWPLDIFNGCLLAESAAGPFPQPIPSIP